MTEPMSPREMLAFKVGCYESILESIEHRLGEDLTVEQLREAIRSSIESSQRVIARQPVAAV